ncbi:MAG: type II toxin-antitoxin system VapC family toxin [Pseudonocardiaceae bacterium]
MELIDTSAWVEYLRATGSPANLEVRCLLHEHPASVVTTEPVVMELLAGAADDRVAQQLETLTGGLRLLPVDATLDYRDAALIYRAARRRGLTVLKPIGCLIATVAARTGATLVHRDRDFDALASTLPDLRVRSLC